MSRMQSELNFHFSLAVGVGENALVVWRQPHEQEIWEEFGKRSDVKNSH